MQWQFKYRKELKTGQYYDLERRGFIKEADREPEVGGLSFYLDAFRELSTSRPVGLELQAIPFTAIAEYFRIYEIADFDDFDDFAYIIRLLDNTFIDLNESASKSEGNKNGSNNANKKNRNKR